MVKGEIPFVRILPPLAAGIIAAHEFLPGAVVFNLSLGLAASVISAFCYLIIFYKSKFRYSSRWIPGAVLYIFIFLSGYLLAVSEDGRLDPSHFSKSSFELLSVRIISEPKLNSNILRFESAPMTGYHKDYSDQVRGKLLVSLQAGSGFDYRYGDLLLIPAEYNEVEPPYNPQEFNYNAYLADHGFYHQAFLSNERVRVLKRDQGNPVVAFALKLRQELVHKLGKYLTDRDAASLASTLILGYRTDLSREILEVYSRTGTMHVLSVSGMHVAIVFMVMLFLLKFMDASRRLRLFRALLMIMLIWFYAIITGFSASVCRAALMISFFIVGKALNRRQNTYNLAAISAVLLLTYNPLFLFDVGFQLSYLAVLGLIYFHPQIYRLLYFKNPLADKVWDYTALSTAAQLATAPLSIYYFHQFPLYFLLSNLFIVVPVTLIMYAGLLFLFIPWDIALRPLGVFLNKCILYTNEGLFYIESLPFASIGGIWINIWICWLLCGFILSVTGAFAYRHKVLIYSSLLILFTVSTWHSFKSINTLRQQLVIFYSLRKDTAIGLFEGRRGVVVTNLNKFEKTFSYAIQPSLESYGIRQGEVMPDSASARSGNLMVSRNLIQFRNWRLMIWDKKFDEKEFSGRISINALLLKGNPAVVLDSLTRYVDFSILLIDGSNSDYRIKAWQRQAEERGIRYYILRRNPAYIVEL